MVENEGYDPEDDARWPEPDPAEIDAYFKREFASFREVLDASIAMSKLQGRRYVATRWDAYPCSIFAKLCLTGVSMRTLIEAGTNSGIDYTLDNTSIGSLARVLVEGSILFSYVSEQGLSADVKDLRLNVLDLHDCTSRVRYFKGIDKNQYRGLKQQLSELRQRLEKNPEYRKLDEEKQKKLRDGHQIFVDGLRGAARNAGWDIDGFDATYVHLSMQSHLAPMSFYRLDEQIDFIWPTTYQFFYAGLCLEIARSVLSNCARGLLNLFPDIASALPPSSLKIINSEG